MQTVTPRRRFFQYKWPHLHNRFANRDVDYETFKEAESYVKSGKEPSEDLLRRCFPNAYYELLKCAKERNLPIWSHEVVGETCIRRAARCRGGHAPIVIREGEVRSENSSNTVLVKIDGEAVMAGNPYGLKFRKGDHVMMSGPVIVELAGSPVAFEPTAA